MFRVGSCIAGPDVGAHFVVCSGMAAHRKNQPDHQPCSNCSNLPTAAPHSLWAGQQTTNTPQASPTFLRDKVTDLMYTTYDAIQPPHKSSASPSRGATLPPKLAL